MAIRPALDALLEHDSLTALIAHASACWKSGAYVVSDEGILEEQRAPGDPDVVDAHVAALRDPDDGVRWTAARALGDSSDPRAIPALIRALGDADDLVAKTAAASLGLLKAQDAVPALIGALERGGHQTRATSAWALGELKAEAGRAALTRALDDRFAMVKQNATTALTRLDKKRR